MSPRFACAVDKFLESRVEFDPMTSKVAGTSEIQMITPLSSKGVINTTIKTGQRAFSVRDKSLNIVIFFRTLIFTSCPTWYATAIGVALTGFAYECGVIRRLMDAAEVVRLLARSLTSPATTHFTIDAALVAFQKFVQRIITHWLIQEATGSPDHWHRTAIRIGRGRSEQRLMCLCCPGQ